MKTFFKYILYSFIPLLLFSCHNDEFEKGGGILGEGEVKVLFKLDLPDGDNVNRSARAISEADENFIKTIDVYSFVSNSDGKYLHNGKVFRLTDPSNPVSYFEATLTAYPNNDQKLLLVVNARDQANDYGIKRHEDIESAREKLIISQAEEWNTTSSADFQPIPMYTETGVLSIRETTTEIGPLTLLRMLAKFTISVKAFNPDVDPEATNPKLVLNSLCIFNRKNKGTVWYDISEANWHVDEKRTIHPNMPEGDFDDLTVFTPGKTFNASDGAIERELYSFEAPFDADPMKRTAVVVGGYYNGDTSKEVFYRIDVPSTVTGGHILRNCHYDIEIQKAKGPGADTAEEAFDITSGKLELHTAVEPWGDAVPIDGDLFGRKLNLSATEVELTEANHPRIYFWSNQKNVFVEPKGRIGDGVTEFQVDSFFEDLSVNVSSGGNFHYDPESGKGYMDIYSNLSEMGSYKHRICLNAGGLKRWVVIRTLLRLPAWKDRPWVGTFHRWDQTGERVIQSSHVGLWSAEVEDPEGAGNFVVLSASPSGDPNIITDNPGDPENYQVKDGTPTVSGRGCIYFRVGMKSKHPDGASHTQPRYARIKVRWKYDNSDCLSYIYVRQGEVPDYVMRPEDPIDVPELVSDTRPFARKISPYNLTVNSEELYVDLPNRGGVFTDYPSQGGRHFQWNQVRAYHPTKHMISPWNSSSEHPWGTNREVCPPGYRYPNDGQYNHIDFPVGAEMGQSFFLKPLPIFVKHADNAIFGYYADGFFDRRPITNIYDFSSNVGTAVNGDLNNVAYPGGLFYNPYTNVSLFMPFAGYRSSTDSKVRNIGSIGWYWSSTTIGIQHSYILMLSGNNNTVESNYYTRNWGASIRCVVDE